MTKRVLVTGTSGLSQALLSELTARSPIVAGSVNPVLSDGVSRTAERTMTDTQDLVQVYDEATDSMVLRPLGAPVSPPSELTRLITKNQKLADKQSATARRRRLGTRR